MSILTQLITKAFQTSRTCSSTRLFQVPLASSRAYFPLRGSRGYSTHTERFTLHDPPPQQGSSSSKKPRFDDLESTTRQRMRNEAFDGRETVGPFPLGVGASGRRKSWRSWRDLGIGGKLVRTTQQTGNLTVILVGGTLFVILTLALTTELFAKNSPSVLYSQAVDLIRASDALNPHLLPPLSFTHTPHSSSPIRGSPPLPHRFVRHPSSGREHMLLTFWVHGRSKDEPEKLGFLKSTWKGIEDWGRYVGGYLGVAEPLPNTDDGLHAALNGNGHSSVSNMSSSGRNLEGSAGSIEYQEGGFLGRLFGGFTGLRSSSGSSSKEVKRGLPPPGTYTVGEVRGDYVKSASGQYTLLSLIIDIPGSNAPHPSRAVVFWSPEADSEGLLGRRR